MKLSEILSGPEKWYQGNLRDYRGDASRVCLRGALMDLAWCEGWSSEREWRESDRLVAVIGVNNRGGLAGWNDAPERTWDEIARVVDAYDRDRMLNP